MVCSHSLEIAQRHSAYSGPGEADDPIEGRSRAHLATRLTPAAPLSYLGPASLARLPRFVYVDETGWHRSECFLALARVDGRIGARLESRAFRRRTAKIGGRRLNGRGQFWQLERRSSWRGWWIGLQTLGTDRGIGENDLRLDQIPAGCRRFLGVGLRRLERPNRIVPNFDTFWLNGRSHFDIADMRLLRAVATVRADGPPHGRDGAPIQDESEMGGQRKDQAFSERSAALRSMTTQRAPGRSSRAPARPTCRGRLARDSKTCRGPVRSWNAIIAEIGRLGRASFKPSRETCGMAGPAQPHQSKPRLLLIVARRQIHARITADLGVVRSRNWPANAIVVAPRHRCHRSGVCGPEWKRRRSHGGSQSDGIDGLCAHPVEGRRELLDPALQPVVGDQGYRRNDDSEA